MLARVSGIYTVILFLLLKPSKYAARGCPAIVFRMPFSSLSLSHHSILAACPLTSELHTCYSLFLQTPHTGHSLANGQGCSSSV